MRSCVVVAAGQTTRDLVRASLNRLALDAVLSASLAELPATLATVPACGVLLESTSVTGASQEQRRQAEDLIEHYPSARFRMADGQVMVVGETLDEFARRCVHFQPRVTRRAERVEKHLAVQLAADQAFTDAENVVTVNVSDSGVFVYTAREWRVGSRVWLRLDGEQAPVAGTVRSFRPWESTEYIPGIGIEVDAKNLRI